MGLMIISCLFKIIFLLFQSIYSRCGPSVFTTQATTAVLHHTQTPEYLDEVWLLFYPQCIHIALDEMGVFLSKQLSTKIGCEAIPVFNQTGRAINWLWCWKLWLYTQLRPSTEKLSVFIQQWMKVKGSERSGLGPTFHIRREAKIILAQLPPLKVYQFPLAFVLLNPDIPCQQCIYPLQTV